MTSKSAPCCKDCMMHSLFIAPNNLLDSIILNLPTYEDVENQDMCIGKPIWEEQMLSNNLSKLKDNYIENATKTYLGRLVPISRFGLINKDCMNIILGNGLEYCGFKEGFKESTATSYYSNKKKEIKLLSYNKNYGIWKQLPSILFKDKIKSNIGGPLCIENIDKISNIEIFTMAMHHSGNEKIENIFESRYAINSTVIKSIYNLIFEKEIKYADDIYKILNDSVYEYCSVIKSNLYKNLSKNISDNFWIIIENNIYLLFNYIKSIGTNEAPANKEIWEYFVKNTAKDTYNRCCNNKTPKGIKAFVLGQRNLLTFSK